jgi:hypothetical protein
MAESDSTPAAPIEELLEQRARYEEWLLRLDGAGSTAPEAVRRRVRGDYEARLHAVIEQLRTYSAGITESLAGHRGELVALEERQTDAQERLAEAEVRHAVGEYTEQEWQKISSDAADGLAGIAEELETVRAEITRLSEVETLILAPAPGAEPAPPPAAPVATKPAVAPPAPVVPSTPAPAVAAEAPTPAPAAGAPRFVPKPSASPASAPAARAPAAPSTPAPAPRVSGPIQMPQGDELAFLKSVTGESEARGAGRRPNENVARQVEPAPGALPETPLEPIAPAPTGAPASAAAASAPAASAAATAGGLKTLKCGECGTLNRPTEWYCERCGAELAAL